jgi:hypothetical protein
VKKIRKVAGPACEWPTPAHGRVCWPARDHTRVAMPRWLSHRPPPHTDAVSGPPPGFPCRPRALLPLPYPLRCVKAKAKFHLPCCSSPSPSLCSSRRYSITARHREPPPSSSQSSSARGRAGARHRQGHLHTSLPCRAATCNTTLTTPLFCSERQ